MVGHTKLKLHLDVNKLAPYLIQPILQDAGPLGTELASNLLNNVPGLGPLLNSLLGPSAGTVGGLAGQTVSSLLNVLKDTPLGTPLISGITDATISLLLDDTSTASATIETFGYGYGWNVGYMYQFSDKTRLGVSYRSESDIRMNGDLDWDFTDLRGSQLETILTPPTLADFESKHYRPDTDARLIFTIPAKLNVGFFTELTNKLDFMLNYTFNKSSVVKNLTVQLPNQSQEVAAKQGEPRILTYWRDSYTLAAGVNYHWSDKLTLRTGLQFDQTPVASAKYRHPGLADNDRWMASLGLGYRLDQHTSVDIAYSYLYILPSDTNYHEPCTGTYYERPDNSIGGPSECTLTGGTFRAHYYDSHAHILGLQFNKRL